MPRHDAGTETPRNPTPPLGVLLKEWRAARRLSQLELSFRVKASARHLSCVETGKSRPSRDLVIRLADELDMPLRERNALLTAAGYAPSYPESTMNATELAPVRRAIALTLDHHEPYPAFVLNRHWDVLLTNAAAGRFATWLYGGSAHDNMIRQFFDPNDVRAVVANWDEVARDLIRHLQQEITAVPTDTTTRALLDEALAYPDVPAAWRARELGASPPPVLTVEFRGHGRRLRFFSTMATFGTARDVTVDELRIECAFPADDATAELCRQLAERAP
jgi:transcriptional regulator with XRE-family HTH domain